MASISQSQTNGIPSSSAAAGTSQSASQPTQNTASSGSPTVQNTQTSNAASAGTGPNSNNNAQAGATASSQLQSQSQSQPQPPSSSSPSPSHAPRPRDARTIELLLTSQGVTSFDQRVPLLILDFAYRHTSAVLSDALHLSTDPYTTHAGSKPSASSGAAPSAPSAGEAVVTTNAINLAIASRQSFQFRGASGASKEWMQEVARERNKIALPRVLANEWGVRLPNERFVLSGMGWTLRDQWTTAMEQDDDEDGDSDEDEEMEEVFDTQKRNAAGNGEEGEGGGLEELLGDDMGEMGDEDMEGME
ncbi:transcription initiation factor IID, 31kD subunit-domain-containing protein [Daldinia caldariorum]|uniref:transcription initiation factor IID, 31kD subunit-domain-containing protein n=1 Tax=Daldinia caldariorum TaxID=326644 RepID=UPI002007ECA3|nr:transcription initiation factor IID, 31kD subunit-domain-containing protein [Daldinia caldariorum]KAI1463165.1 transcription initiation factor IID, 31kD subunit-domain-containing protein [Daldinia caldariorum]